MYCRDCSYPLDHLDQQRCPECGRPFDPESPRTYRRRARRISRGWSRLLVAVLVIAVYVSSYFILVEKGPSLSLSANPPYSFRQTPKYRVGGEVASVVYSPAHWVDRRIRQQYWQDLGWIEYPNLSGAI